MTLIYVPQRIESVEQAEALPKLSFWFSPAEVEAEGWVQPWVKGNNTWFGDDEDELRAPDLVGRTVFVPVEAEEETTRAEPFADGTIHVSPQYWRDEPSRRLVTPWEPVSGPSPDHSLDGREAHK